MFWKKNKRDPEINNPNVYTTERLLSEGKTVQDLTNDELLASSKSLRCTNMLLPSLTTEINRRINNYG